MPQIISASRRTDIPAWYADWFARRLDAGYVFVKNPFSQKMYRISLLPHDVDAIVFWSKNYAPLLPILDVIEQSTKNLFFHFTITANSELEFAVPHYRDAIRDYLYLVKRYSSEQVVWRFDPLVITDKLTFEVHEERFTRCAELLQGHVRRCIISFMHPYKKVLANMNRFTGRSLPGLTADLKREYALRLANRADKYRIQLYSCCNDYLLSDKILKSRCIDGKTLSTIFAAPIDSRRAATRSECACTKSTDIGAYDTCAHGCIYCYANSSHERAGEAQRRQDREWNALGMHVDEKFDPDKEPRRSLFV
jgi:hypothetical protein